MSIFRGIPPLIALLFFLLTSLSVNAQSDKVILSREQALEDFRWLRFSLEYVHPRLYKFEDKKTVDARFDSLTSKLSAPIPGIDFLSLVSIANASVRCGHLFTIPQGQLAEEI